MAELLCNLGVVIAAVIIMQVRGEGRYYADPGASIVIGLVIVTFAARLGRFLHTVVCSFTYTFLAKTNWDLLHQRQNAQISSEDGDFELNSHVDTGTEHEDSTRGMGIEDDGEVGESNEKAEGGVGNEWSGEKQDPAEESSGDFDKAENFEEVANTEEEGEQKPTTNDLWGNGEPEETGGLETNNEEFSNDQNEVREAHDNSGDAEGGEEATPDDENTPNEDAGGNDEASSETNPPTEDNTITDSGGDGVVKQIVQSGKRAKKALIYGTNYIEKRFKNSWNSDEGDQTRLKNDNSWDEKGDAREPYLGPKVEEGGWV